MPVNALRRMDARRLRYAAGLALVTGLFVLTAAQPATATVCPPPAVPAAPQVTHDTPLAWAGDPHRFTARSSTPGVAAYTYQLDQLPPLTTPALLDGSALLIVTPLTGGNHTLTVTAVTLRGVVSAPTVVRFGISTQPKVFSRDFPFEGRPGVPAGTPGVFFFAPGQHNVIAYVYSFNGGGEQMVDAGPDGAASVVYVPAYSGIHSITVASVDWNGRTGQPISYDFEVS